MEKVREELRNEEIKKILDNMTEEYQIDKVKDLIKNNQIEFDYLEKNYRVRLLTPKEVDELDLIRRRRFGQLIRDKDILLESDLIVAYKEKGIDIKSIDEEINHINNQITDQNYKLGEALAKTPGDTILNTYKKEIINLTYKLRELTIQRSHLLEYSLENHLQNYVAQAISYLCLDKKVEDKWIRAFDTLDDFMSQDDRLVNLVAMYSTYLHYR